MSLIDNLSKFVKIIQEPETLNNPAAIIEATSVINGLVNSGEASVWRALDSYENFMGLDHWADHAATRAREAHEDQSLWGFDELAFSTFALAFGYTDRMIKGTAQFAYDAASVVGNTGYALFTDDAAGAVITAVGGTWDLGSGIVLGLYHSVVDNSVAANESYQNNDMTGTIIAGGTLVLDLLSFGLMAKGASKSFSRTASIEMIEGPANPPPIPPEARNPWTFPDRAEMYRTERLLRSADDVFDKEIAIAQAKSKTVLDFDDLDLLHEELTAEFNQPNRLGNPSDIYLSDGTVISSDLMTAVESDLTAWLNETEIVLQPEATALPPPIPAIDYGRTVYIGPLAPDFSTLRGFSSFLDDPAAFMQEAASTSVN